MSYLRNKKGRVSPVISARVDRRIAAGLENAEARPPKLVRDWLHCDAVEEFVKGLPPTTEPEPPPVVCQPEPEVSVLWLVLAVMFVAGIVVGKVV